MAGSRVAPRIVAAGPILDGGVPDSNRWTVNNEVEARQAVDSLARAGVDFIKVHEHLNRETYFAIAEEANKLSIPFAGHVPVDATGFAVSGIEASNARQKSLEHMFGIPFPGDTSIPELIRTLKKNGTWVDPTLIVFWNRAHVHELASQKDKLKYIAPALRQFWDGQTRDWSPDIRTPEMLLQFRQAGVGALHEGGVSLLAGTDLGFPYVYPGDLRKELALLVEAGLSPIEALCTATINPSRYLNQETELGSVDEGKLADLVLLDANPLNDIRALELVRAVILNGKVYDRAALDAMIPTYGTP